MSNVTVYVGDGYTPTTAVVHEGADTFKVDNDQNLVIYVDPAPGCPDPALAPPFKRVAIHAAGSWQRAEVKD